LERGVKEKILLHPSLRKRRELAPYKKKKKPRLLNLGGKLSRE
jgi:hypothetical protein